MLYSDIEVKEITTGDEYEQAFTLLVEEFPDHRDTDLTFYEYLFIAINKKSNEVIGVITGNKYLPMKVQLCDIVIAPGHRSKAIAMKLLKVFCIQTKKDGYVYGTGITNKKNKEAINTYRKLGGHQEEMIVTTANLDETIAIASRKEYVLECREKKREKE
jgi:ribosomal protein S18 acetylase RimI-like enzyme